VWADCSVAVAYRFWESKVIGSNPISPKGSGYAETKKEKEKDGKD
jgi:hypothetical protein